jgi:pimeloyl-ACP methyl ester carboxylesterase
VPGSDVVTRTLDVPSARLSYGRQGSGPLLALIGSPMGSTGFAGLAGALAGNCAVVTYDPRGIVNSSREDAGQDVTPEQQAGDVHRLLSVSGGEPAAPAGQPDGYLPGGVHSWILQPPVHLACRGLQDDSRPREQPAAGLARRPPQGEGSSPRAAQPVHCCLGLRLGCVRCGWSDSSSGF